jgi:hypothetical protein
MTRRSLGLLGALGLAIGTPPQVLAQTASSADQWQFLVVPYVLFPHMDGAIGLGPVSVDVDASPSDVFSNLQFGAMLAAEARRGPWAIGFNGMYMNLSDELETITGPGGVQLDGELGAYQGMFELTGFRALTPYLEVLAGGRFNFVGADVDLVAAQGSLNQDFDESWFDPFIGVRLTVPNTGKWTVAVRGDIGGFGIGSDFAWQVRGRVGYRVSNLIELGAGYWASGMDYESGIAPTQFTYDVTTFGPQIGIGFHF